MPKIVGYYDAPASALGATNLASLVGIDEAMLTRVATGAISATLPDLEQRLNQKLILAGAAIGAGFLGLAALIWSTRSR